MICKWCGKEIPDDSLFCNKCGKNQEQTDKNGMMKNETEEDKKGNTLNKRIMLFAGTGIALVVVIVLVLVLKNNPMKAFMQSINENNYSEAVTIYEDKIKGNSEKEKEIEDNLNLEINSIVEDFTNGKVDYDNTKIQLETIRSTTLLGGEVNSAIKTVDGLHNSRIAFSKGLEFTKSKNYFEAMIEFKKVIVLDTNYTTAQENINHLSEVIKAEVLEDIDSLANNKNYEEAIKKTEAALNVLPNDVDLIAKLSNYEKLAADKKEEEFQQMIIKLEKEQEVAVIGTSEYTDSINTNFISVTVENRSQKRVKSYDIGFMGFDKDGLPVKVGLGSGDFVRHGHNDQNILPGSRKDSRGGWYLDNHDVATLIACIENVEYYEGDKWINPYYSLWVEKYAEKPLK